MSIEVQRWFSLRCIVPKISTINLEQDFAGFKYKTPRNKALYLNVNIFGTMDRKLNHLWTSIDTGPLCKFAKCSSTILHNQSKGSATCREPYIEIREVINTLDNKVRGGGGGGGRGDPACHTLASTCTSKDFPTVHDHAACLYHLEHCRVHSVHCLGRSSVQSIRV